MNALLGTLRPQDRLADYNSDRDLYALRRSGASRVWAASDSEALRQLDRLSQLTRTFGRNQGGAGASAGGHGDEHSYAQTTLRKTEATAS
jgi:hypothetical protein